MIKKMTDEILDNPKERDAKQKSQDEAVSACKLLKFWSSFIFTYHFFNAFSDPKFWKSYGAHDSCQCHQHPNWLRGNG